MKGSLNPLLLYRGLKNDFSLQHSVGLAHNLQPDGLYFSLAIVSTPPLVRRACILTFRHHLIIIR